MYNILLCSCNILDYTPISSFRADFCYGSNGVNLRNVKVTVFKIFFCVAAVICKEYAVYLLMNVDSGSGPIFHFSGKVNCNSFSMIRRKIKTNLSLPIFRVYPLPVKTPVAIKNNFSAFLGSNKMMSCVYFTLCF